MNSIILIGFMGTGKTVVGKKLAERLRMKFVDIDELIEKQSGMSISQMFERFGESHFRKRESKIVSELSEQNSLVIAAGGGAVLDSRNMTNLKKMGSVIHLYARPDVILDRTKQEHHRPLLETMDRERQIQQLLNERRPFYAGADCEIDTSDLDIEGVVEKIVNSVRESFNGRSED